MSHSAARCGPWGLTWELVQIPALVARSGEPFLGDLRVVLSRALRPLAVAPGLGILNVGQVRLVMAPRGPGQPVPPRYLAPVLR